jgi:hypothetical protein
MNGVLCAILRLNLPCRKQTMKRDLNLMREILERAEALTPVDTGSSDDFPGRDGRVVAYHIDLLERSGYVRAIVQQSNGNDAGPIHATVWDLTMAGHNYLVRTRRSAA